MRIRARVGGRRRLRLLGLAAGLIVALAACGGSASSGASSGSGSKAATGSPIPVGGICDVTGPNSFVESCQAAKAYFDQVNSQGGIKGHPITYTSEDEANNASTSAQVGSRLIDQTKVDALVGGANMYQCSQNASLMASSGVYAIDGLGIDAACWRIPQDTPVNNGPLLGYAVALYFLSKVQHEQNLCAMAANLPNSLPTDYNAFNVVPQIIGQSVHKTLLWNPGGDLTPIVSGTKDNNCKALVMVGSEPTFISMMRTATSQGMTDGSITWMGLTTGYTTHAAQSIAQANGYWVNSELAPWSLDTGTVAEFKQLQKKAGFLLDSTAECGYLAAKMFVKALNTIQGPITRQSVGQAMAAMKDVSTDGLTGQPFTWGKYNLSSQFLQLKQGKFEPYGGPQGKWYTVPATSAQVKSIVTGQPVSR
ncbi:MAG: ABC transporter substrate-binding protein [Candidatus Dormibacteraeota bacterium]|nr:ABC transporter substrate-binding protein [Candidatus Dormibacteraeota bacterium]